MGTVFCPHETPPTEFGQPFAIALVRHTSVALIALRDPARQPRGRHDPAYPGSLQPRSTCGACVDLERQSAVADMP